MDEKILKCAWCGKVINWEEVRLRVEDFLLPMNFMKKIDLKNLIEDDFINVNLIFNKKTIPLFVIPENIPQPEKKFDVVAFLCSPQCVESLTHAVYEERCRRN